MPNYYFWLSCFKFYALSYCLYFKLFKIIRHCRVCGAQKATDPPPPALASKLPGPRRNLCFLCAGVVVRGSRSQRHGRRGTSWILVPEAWHWEASSLENQPRKSVQKPTCTGSAQKVPQVNIFYYGFWRRVQTQKISPEKQPKSLPAQDRPKKCPR